MSDRLALFATYDEYVATCERQNIAHMGPTPTRLARALVEVAKAARDVLDDHTLPRLDSPNRARLRAALSALDGEEAK